MIVTKQRKSLQLSSPYTRGQKQMYRGDNSLSLFREYRPQAESVPINYANRERHNISAVSSISKNMQKFSNSYSKKTDKKYDYSVNLDTSFEKDQLNRTNDHVNEKFSYLPQNKGQTYKTDFILEQYEKRRVASVTQSSSKYFPTDQKKQPIVRLLQPYPTKNSSNQQQKIDLNSYLKSYEPKYQSLSKPQQKKENPISNKENHPLIRRPLINQNFMQDNFGATDKFQEFKSQNCVNTYQETKNKSKYEPRYTGMRNNKRYEITKKDSQNLRQQESFQKHENEQNTFSQKPIDLKKLLKDSHTQNTKIAEKINRIQKLNQEINKKLQSMLHRKQIF